MRSGVGLRRDQAAEHAQTGSRGGRNNGVLPPGGTYTRSKPIDHDATPSAGSTRSDARQRDAEKIIDCGGGRRRGTGGLKIEPENPNVAARPTAMPRTNSLQPTFGKRDRSKAVPAWSRCSAASARLAVANRRSPSQAVSISGLRDAFAQPLVLDGGIANRACVLIRCRKACRFEPCSRSQLFAQSRCRRLAVQDPGFSLRGSRVRIPPAAPLLLSRGERRRSVRQLPSLIPVSRTTRAHLS